MNRARAEHEPGFPGGSKGGVRRRPSAMAGSQHSSRWKRIVRGMRGVPGLKELLEDRRGGGGLQLVGEPEAVGEVGVDLVLVVEVVGEGGVDLGEGEGGVLGDDLVGGEAEALVADGDVLDLDAVAVDAGLAAAGAGGPDDAGQVEGVGVGGAGEGVHGGIVAGRGGGGGESR